MKDTDEAEALFTRLQMLLPLARQVFKNECDAFNWFEESAYGLGGRKPIELLDTDEGASVVKDYLGAIEQGNYW